MELISNLALAGGLSWASGIRLYATVFIVGVLSKFNYIHFDIYLFFLVVFRHTLNSKFSGQYLFKTQLVCSITYIEQTLKKTLKQKQLELLQKYYNVNSQN